MNILRASHLSASFSGQTVVKSISIDVPLNQVVALIGPSGCGKSTFIRTLNRLHEETEGATVTGSVLLEGQDIYGVGVDPVEVRRKIGMVFQKANPFPGMTIAENVSVGLDLQGGFSKSEIESRVERALKSAALWDEVKDKLRKPGTSLSGGQSQRLCIARALAVEPKVLLMDEPTSALDPISTARIEELIFELKKQTTVVIVTHNMQQAARVSDQTAFLFMGELIEIGATKTLFTNPKERQTERYITGRFG